jgi:hypothetical protein
MSEASWEEGKRKAEELRQKAYSAKYHILCVSERRYGVITIGSWCPGESTGDGYANFRFVPGLERVRVEVAREAVTSLNRGLTKEHDYEKQDHS